MRLLVSKLLCYFDQIAFSTSLHLKRSILDVLLWMNFLMYVISKNLIKE